MSDGAVNDNVLYFAGGVLFGAAIATGVLVSVSPDRRAPRRAAPVSSASAEAAASDTGVDTTDAAARDGTGAAATAARADLLLPGRGIDATLGSPSRAPKSFDFQTNMHSLRARKGEKLSITVEAEEPTGLQPFVILWSSDRGGAPDRRIAMERSRGESRVELTRRFDRSGSYVLSVDDARNLPLEGPDPELFYGGPRFDYTLRVEEATGAGADAREAAISDAGATDN